MGAAIADIRGGGEFGCGGPVSEPRVVAVTGGAGFVGLNLVVKLAQRSPRSRPAPFAAGRRGAVWRMHMPAPSSSRPATCAMATLAAAIEAHGVADAAARTSPRRDETLAMLDVNLRATQVLLDLAAAGRLRRVVFVSSAGVFRSGESATPLAEDAPVTMEHPYAILKVAAERLVAFARRRRNVDATAVRLGFVYWPYERPTGSRTAMSSVYEAVALARRGEPIVATGPEVGRDWIHAGDVARGILMLLDHDRPLAPLYHLGTGRNYSMRETIEMIATLVPGTRVRWTDDAREANVVVAATTACRVGVRPGAGRFRIRAAVCVARRSARLPGVSPGYGARSCERAR